MAALGRNVDGEGAQGAARSDRFRLVSLIYRKVGVCTSRCCGRGAVDEIHGFARCPITDTAGDQDEAFVHCYSRSIVMVDGLKEKSRSSCQVWAAVSNVRRKEFSRLRFCSSFRW